MTPTDEEKTKMIDPKTLEVGDVVTLTGTVKDIYSMGVRFDEHNIYSWNTPINGKLCGLTITKVEKPAFDWKDVKNGYAFKKAPKEDVCIYSGHHPEDKDRVFFYNRTKGWFDWTNKDNLTRAPEYDLPEFG